MFITNLFLRKYRIRCIIGSFISLGGKFQNNFHYFFNAACAPLKEVPSRAWETTSALGSVLAAASPKKAKSGWAGRMIPERNGKAL